MPLMPCYLKNYETNKRVWKFKVISVDRYTLIYVFPVRSCGMCTFQIYVTPELYVQLMIWKGLFHCLSFYVFTLEMDKKKCALQY